MISEYTAYSGNRSPPRIGSAHTSLVFDGIDRTCGTAAPSGNVSRVPADTTCRPTVSCPPPSTRSPSTRPTPLKGVAREASKVVSESNVTVVCFGNSGNCGPVRSRAPCACQAITRNTTGTAIAVSLSQYWNACTNVMLRIPPEITFVVTTTATTSAPTQSGAPVTVCRVSPAPCNCGSRYSHPIPSANTLATARTAGDANHDQAKSGSVYAPL